MKKITFSNKKVQLNKQKISVLHKEQMSKLAGGLVNPGEGLDPSLDPDTGINASKKYPELCPPPKSDRLCGGSCSPALSGW
ncbi:class I lanthipeptide [Chryseobacterium sp. G0201]|uniref:class I lanthipeptide n=1 Tax=Chryseobacterium sp. G0201 TaxID=2487065 RepID=UPI000F4EE623|nr:class I lanthipeptide [Chryseobacterium sp. G0201]AZA55195.1 hypothetical protein EG348_20430 [Chryseobacterium sp. G0201]